MVSASDDVDAREWSYPGMTRYRLPVAPASSSSSRYSGLSGGYSAAATGRSDAPRASVPRERLRASPRSAGSSMLPFEGVKKAGRKNSVPRLRRGRGAREGVLGVSRWPEKYDTTPSAARRMALTTL